MELLLIMLSEFLDDLDGWGMVVFHEGAGRFCVSELCHGCMVIQVEKPEEVVGVCGNCVV